MTAFAMTVPAGRRSASIIPRRDMTLGGGDDLTLNLTLVESDRPDSPPLDLAGIGPQVQMLVWYTTCTWDYGRGDCPAGRAALLSVLGTIEQDTTGRVTIHMARGSLGQYGRRLGYSLQLDYGDDLSEIQWGALQVRQGAILAQTEFDILDDNDVPITDDDDQDIEG